MSGLGLGEACVEIAEDVPEVRVLREAVGDGAVAVDHCGVIAVIHELADLVERAVSEFA